MIIGLQMVSVQYVDMSVQSITGPMEHALFVERFVDTRNLKMVYVLFAA